MEPRNARNNAKIDICDLTSFEFLDVDGDALVYTLNSGAAHGLVTVDTNGRFTYSPNLGFKGSDSFSFTVSDGVFDSAATVSLLVNNDSVGFVGDLLHPKLTSIDFRSGDLATVQVTSLGTPATLDQANPQPRAGHMPTLYKLHHDLLLNLSDVFIRTWQ